MAARLSGDVFSLMRQLNGPSAHDLSPQTARDCQCDGKSGQQCTRKANAAHTAGLLACRHPHAATHIEEVCDPDEDSRPAVSTTKGDTSI